MGAILLTATIPISCVRETSPPYGTPPASSPTDVAHDLIDAFHALAQAESAVALAEGDTLRLVLDQRRYQQLGFSSFHDFCVEAAEMTPSTAKRRVATSRLAAEIPELRTALIEGKVSQCQALELRPVLTTESAPWWIALASQSSLVELRSAVLEARERAESSTSSPGASASSKASVRMDEGAPEGRRISVAAPVAARLAFEEGLECARKMLGYEAPRHACVAAMLAEVADTGLTAEVRGSDATPPDREEMPAAESRAFSKGVDSEPADARQRRLQRLARSQHPIRPFPNSKNAAPRSRTGTSATHDDSSERLRSASGTSSARSISAFLRESMTRAGATIAHVYQQLDSFSQLLEETPTAADVADPASMVERLEDIRALAAPIHVLSLRILLHLEDLSASRYLGLRSNDALAEAHLRLAPRTFRQLLSEAWQMKRRPELEAAYLSGRAGVSRLRLLAAVEPSYLEKFLARAGRVTLRQLRRELRLREKHVALRDQLQREREAQERFALRHQVVEMGVRRGPNHGHKDRPPVVVLSDRSLDPLPGRGLDVSLVCILLQHGHLADELQNELTRPGLCTAEEAAALIASARALAGRTKTDHRDEGGTRAAQDDQANPHEQAYPYDQANPNCPANPYEQAYPYYQANSHYQAHPREQAQPHDEASTHEPTNHPDQTDQFGTIQRDPAANPSLMRRLEVLTDLALLVVCDDSVQIGSEVYPRGRQSLNLEGDFCRISFWAPDPVIEDLNRFLDRLRERTGPLPAWASLMILVRDAVDAWKQVVRRSKRPRWWRVFERDEYRCQTPACSKRADLHAHHVVFRSHGGSNDLRNMVSACFGHHQQGVHEGHIRCTGNANRGLRWVLGPRAKHGGPFRIYRGDLRIR